MLQILFALGFASAALAAGANGPIVHHTQLDWDNDTPWFGGLSGVEMRADGKQMTVISDRGRIMVADLARDALGTLTGLEVIHSVALRDQKGAVMDKPHADAEGLAIAPDGSIFISYEGQHRIARTNLADGTTEQIIAPPQGALLRENAGFEALAVDAEGSLYALPEDTRSNQISIKTTRGALPPTLKKTARSCLSVPISTMKVGYIYLSERLPRWGFAPDCGGSNWRATRPPP